MKCTSRVCHLQCLSGNCKMTCYGVTSSSGCYPKCEGSDCEIDVHSERALTFCRKGSCIVRFSKNTNGKLYCPAGNCTLTCAKGRSCELGGSCPNCTGPLYVDDPFGKSNATVNCKDVVLLYLYGVFAVFFILLV